MDPVGGRTRLVKDIAREHGASDHEITRAYLRVSAGLRPNALAFQYLDAYAAAWRDALVKELRAYKAAVQYCANAIRARRRDEARFLATMKGAKTHNKTRAHRAWRRNDECMARHHHSSNSSSSGGVFFESFIFLFGASSSHHTIIITTTSPPTRQGTREAPRTSARPVAGTLATVPESRAPPH